MPDPIDIAVGERLRRRRRDIDFTQVALAGRLGITFQQVQKYERGTNRVSASMLVKAAAILRTSVASLVGEESTAPEPHQLDALRTPGAAELLAAFVGIPDGDQRRALLAIAQGLCPPAPPRRRLAA